MLITMHEPGLPSILSDRYANAVKTNTGQRLGWKAGEVDRTKDVQTV